MLRCLISDLSRAGHRTVTSIDSRLMNASPFISANQVIPVSSKAQLANVFSKAVKSVDATCVIAPEADGILEDLVRKSQEACPLSLNCSADSIHASSDKAAAFDILKKADIRVPETRVIDLQGDSEATVKEAIGIGPSLILKPVRGGGCSGLNMVTTENELKSTLAKTRTNSTQNFVIVQEAIHGIAASVNVICSCEGASPLTLNQQFVSISSPCFESAYLGGLVPLEHDLEDQALEAAVRAVECFPGLSGYVGVDMVLTDEEVFIIEVNPRVTTSYIGARRVLNVNLGEAMVQAAAENRLPQEARTLGYAIFYKVPGAWSSYAKLSKESLQVEIISPSLESGYGVGDSLVLVYTPTFMMAKAVRSIMSEVERG